MALISATEVSPGASLALCLQVGKMTMDMLRPVQQQKHSDGDRLPKVAIVIVHAKNVENTIECVESLFLSDYANTAIIICDNNSEMSVSDHLVDRIKDITNCQINILNKKELCQLSDGLIRDISIIRCGENLGYAAAANLGFMLSLKDASTKYAWLLNDDVAVEPGCLMHMVSRSEAAQIRESAALDVYIITIVIESKRLGAANSLAGAVGAR
jgi:hypothetical protein